MHPDAPLELVQLDEPYVADPSDLAAYDMVLERVRPGARPHLTTGLAKRHAVRLYGEAVALIIAADHELASTPTIDRETLALVTLLEHLEHAAEWPAAEAWADESWRPQHTKQLLELVATGVSGALMPFPLARQMVRRGEHAVVTVADPDPLPETEIWASWAIERDAADVQELLGVLRGRTARSSRNQSQSASSAHGEPGARNELNSRSEPNPRGRRSTSGKRDSRSQSSKALASRKKRRRA